LLIIVLYFLINIKMVFVFNGEDHPGGE